MQLIFKIYKAQTGFNKPQEQVAYYLVDSP